MPDDLPPTATTVDAARQLLEYLAQQRGTLAPLLILTHDCPDPDALAAALALHHLAQQRFGIESRIAYGGVVGRVENRAMVKLLRIPARPLRQKDLKRFKQVALVDTQPAFENNPFPANRRAALVIDQHASTEPPLADLALIDTGCGATSVILAQALLLSGTEIPARVATALAYGILSDTLDLYRASRADVVETYLRILHDSDMKVLARIQNPPRSRDFFLMLGYCIREAALYRRLIVAHLGAVQSPDVVAQMAEFLLTYNRVAWSLCTGRYKGRLHVSLRTSRPDVQAGQILRDVFDNRNEAGGHRAIGGGSFRVGLEAAESTWREREQKLQDRLVKRLRLPRRGEFRRPFQR